MIPWGGWRPDVSGPNGGFCSIADNVLPGTMGDGSGGQIISYGPFPQLVTPGGAVALGAECRGACWLVKRDGTYENYFATAAKIRKLSAVYDWSDVETGRTLNDGDDVAMLHVGNVLLNSDPTNGMKAYDVETPAGNNAVSGAPAARILGLIQNVVFAGDCDGDNRLLRSTAVLDYANWATQGAMQVPLTDGGAIQAIGDLKNGVGYLLQTQGFKKIVFGAAPDNAMYGVYKIADDRGSVGQRSVVSIDGVVWFLDSDGWWRYDEGGGLVPFGAEKFNRWFLEQVDNSRLNEVQATVDPKNKIMLARFPSTSNSSTSVFDRVVCYDWQLNEGFTLTVNTGWLSRLATPGYTLDDMDVFGNLDDMEQIPLDSRFWRGGQPILSGLDSDGKYATFSGSPMAATLQGAPQMQDQRRLVNEVTQVTNDSAAELSINALEKLGDADNWKGPFTRSTRSGRTKTRASGRILTPKSTHAAGNTWAYDNGIDFPKTIGMGE